MARQAGTNPQTNPQLQANNRQKYNRKYDSSRPDPAQVGKIRNSMYKISPLYSLALIIPIGTLMSGGKMDTVHLSMIMWGSVAWYAALTLRLPFQGFATRNPGFDYHGVMAIGTGFMDAFVRYIFLYLYPGGASIGRAFSLAIGWGSLEAFAGFFSVALADRTDPQAIEAKRRMQEINMPDPLSINPIHSFFDHIAESLFTLANCIIILSSADPMIALLSGLVHSALLYVGRVSLRGTQFSSIFLAVSSFALFCGSLVLVKFYNDVY
ncbi:hypothetical protein BC829DRAFT_392785 [Chytridium lagenaria]|nr:hypothetical protein BC829DRAFT_392785 [Chytridium lagenaria]